MMRRKISLLSCIIALFATLPVYAQMDLGNVPYLSCEDKTSTVANIYIYRPASEYGTENEVKVYAGDSLLTALKNKSYYVYVVPDKRPVKLRSEVNGKSYAISFGVQPGRIYYVESGIRGKKASRMKPTLRVEDPHYAFPEIEEIRDDVAEQ